MAEQEEKPTKGRWSSISSFFVTDDKDTPQAPSPTAAGRPMPAAIPGRPIPAPIPGRPSSYVQQAVDQGMVDRLLAELEGEAPQGYKDFVGDLATLSEALPTDELIYKSALKLAGKQGHTPAGLSLDYEKCLRLLDEQGRMFEASVQEQITAKVGGRQAEVARLDDEIAKLAEQLTQLQAQRDAEAEAIETDTARIETTKIKFQGAFAAVHAQLNDQKTKLAAFGGKG